MKRKIPFKKIHGLGNDFVLIKYDYVSDFKEADLPKLAKEICCRQTGIGADGLIIPFPSSKSKIKMRIWNADGSEAEMCGNGIRCMAKFVYEENIIQDTSFPIETLGGIMVPELYIRENEVYQVKVDMGCPKDLQLYQSLSVDNQVLTYHYCLLGVPHVLIFVEDLDNLDLTYIGPKIEKHPIFPEGTNVNFAKQISEDRIQVRTWERGAGATLACGTGSSSVAFLSYQLGLVPSTAYIDLKLGSLEIKTDLNSNRVFMNGPAQKSFEGYFYLP